MPGMEPPKSAIATYEERCPACDEMIRDGDVIVLNADEEWVHDGCGES